MKKLLTTLSAAIIGSALVGIALVAPAANGAPPAGAKVSIRATIDRNCVATVHVSWVRFDPLNTVYVEAYRLGSGEYAEYAPMATASRDKLTLTFVGEPQSEPVTSVFQAYLNGAEAIDEVTKRASCDNWAVVQ